MLKLVKAKLVKLKRLKSRDLLNLQRVTYEAEIKPKGK